MASGLAELARNAIAFIVVLLATDMGTSYIFEVGKGTEPLVV
jgi:hypothetical protein